MAKIYVASSWRNEYQQEVVRLLRDDGHAVYDFKGGGDGWSEDDGPGGFSWKTVDPEWQTWPNDIPRYLSGLDHPLAIRGFNRDMDALRCADACVMVMPCGPSASMEMGWAAGANRFVAVYIPGMREPDLMVKMADLVTDDLSRVRTALRVQESIVRYTPLEQEIALWYIANGGMASIQDRVRRASKEMEEAVQAAVEPVDKLALAEELADVYICLTIAANKLGVSLTQAALQKLAINIVRKWDVQQDGTLNHVRGTDPRG